MSLPSICSTRVPASPMTARLDEDLAMTFNRNLLANEKADKDDNDKPESPSS
jgi:hypothetical protein